MWQLVMIRIQTVIKKHKTNTQSFSSITTTTTVTPTVTATVPYFYTIPPSPGGLEPQKRDAALSTPYYLTNFPASEISSACSCLSITPSTTTVKATSTVVVRSIITVMRTVTKSPLTTTAAKVTISASTTVTECAAPYPTFIVKMRTSIVMNGTQLQGTYGSYHVYYEPYRPYHLDRIAFNGLTNSSKAAILQLDDEPYPHELRSPETDYFSFRFGNETGVQALHFEDPDLRYLGSDTINACSIGGGLLTCATADGATIFQLCPETLGFNDLLIGPTVGTGCSEVALEVVPICTSPPFPS